jgi:polyhydroxyalkanoate synthesis regulator phasin
MDVTSKLLLIQEGYSFQEINESSFNFPLPQWKDENRVTHEKQQIKTRIGKLRQQQLHGHSDEIAKQIEELQKRYDEIVSSTPPSTSQQKKEISHKIFLLKRSGAEANKERIAELEEELHKLHESSLPDFLLINNDYVTESVMDILTESSNGGFLSYISRFFKWIKEKVLQFIAFLKSKFSRKKSKADEAKSEWKEKYPELAKLVDMKSINYEMTVHSHVYDKPDYDFFAKGIEKVFDIFDDRIQRIIGLTQTDSKVVMFTDSIIDNEKRFLDSIFAEVFKTPYSEESIYENLYGPNKKVIVWPKDDMDYLYEKAKHMERQQEKIIDYADKVIPAKLKLYEQMITKELQLSLDRIDNAKKANKWNIVNAEQRVLADYKSKLDSLIKLYNYMFKLATDFTVVHNSIAWKFLDGLSQITMDMAGKIVLPTKK